MSTSSRSDYQRSASAPAGPPRHPARYDYEYKREGTANLFLLSQLLIGWRQLLVTERRTAQDFAEVLRYLAKDLYPEIDRLVLVTDNLITHTMGCVYEAFPPDRAQAIAERLVGIAPQSTGRGSPWPRSNWRR